MQRTQSLSNVRLRENQQTIASITFQKVVGTDEPIFVQSQPNTTVEQIKENISWMRGLSKEYQQIRRSKDGQSLPDEDIVEGGTKLYLVTGGDQTSNTPPILHVGPWKLMHAKSGPRYPAKVQGHIFDGQNVVHNGRQLNGNVGGESNNNYYYGNSSRDNGHQINGNWIMGGDDGLKLFEHFFSTKPLNGGQAP